MLNPLLDAVAKIVEVDGILPASEFQLLQLLVARGQLQDDYARDNLALFQAHFLLMNALYERQEYYRSEQQNQAGKGYWLSISPLRIALLPAAAEVATAIVADSDSLAHYYLDWQNFQAASAESVEALLGHFWRRYLNQDKACQALALLGLELPSSWQQVKQRYRQLAMIHHPDRGGEHEYFTQLQQALAELKIYFAESS